MTHHENGSGPEESTTKQASSDPVIRSLDVGDQTILYDPATSARFIQSDTAVDLIEAR